MASFFKSLLFTIRAESKANEITITGLGTKMFFKELSRVFGTVRFQNGMFYKVKGRAFSISRFFLYDFYLICQMMLEKGSAYYNRANIKELLQELEKLPEIERISKTFPSRFDRKELERFKFQPLPHQSEFFEEYDKNTQRYDLNGYILASPPGTGKTVTSLMLQAMLNKDIVLVFSPKNALNEVWEETLSEIKGAKAWIYPDVVIGNNYTHYVFNHENTSFALDTVKSILKKNKNANIGVIVDECHKFTELSADQTNNLIDIIRLCQSADVLFMSGTPFKALGRELLPFLLSTDPTFGQRELEGFRKIFGASGMAAREILSARIGRTLYHVEKSEVVSNDETTFIVKVKVPNGERFTLPSIRKKMQEFVTERVEYYQKNSPKMVADYQRFVEQHRKTLVTKEQFAEFQKYKTYAELIRNTKKLTELKKEMVFCNLYERKQILPSLNSADRALFSDVKSVYKYVNLKIQGEALGRILGAERTACNEAIVNHIDQGKIYSEKADLHGEDFDLDDIFDLSESKVVMFTDFVRVLQTTERILKSRGYHPEVVYGETNNDLTGIISRFEKDPKINPIVATFKSLSTAVPLIMSDTCVLLNVPYRDYIYKQTTARIDRIGQKHPVKILEYQLDTGDIDNISTRSKDLMEWSRKMVESLLGIESTDVEDYDDVAVNEVHDVPLQSNESLIAKW